MLSFENASSERRTLRPSKDETQEAYDESVKRQLEVFTKNSGEFINQLNLLRGFAKGGYEKHESKDEAEKNVLENFKSKAFVEYYGADSKEQIEALTQVLDIPPAIAQVLRDRVYRLAEEIVPTLKSDASDLESKNDYEVLEEKEAMDLLASAKIDLQSLEEEYSGLLKNAESDKQKETYVKVLEECHDLHDRLTNYHADAIQQFSSIRSAHGLGDAEGNLLILKKNLKFLLQDIDRLVEEKSNPETLKEVDIESGKTKDIPPALGDWSDL